MKRKRGIHLFAVFIMGIMVLSKMQSFGAEGNQNKIVLQINNPRMIIQGKEMEIDPGKGTSPIIVKNKTLLPIRSLIEALGGHISWVQEEKKIVVLLKDKKIEMWIGKNTTTVNSVNKEIDVSPQIINGRTMIPLRYVIENLGYPVEWNGTEKKIVINVDYSPVTLADKEAVKDYLLKADGLKYDLIKNVDYKNYDQKANLAPVTGTFSSYKTALEYLKKYFKEELAIKEMNYFGLQPKGDKLYKITADGDQRYIITDESEVKFIENKENKKVVTVQKFCDLEGALNTDRYTIEQVGTNWIITKIEKLSMEEEVYFNEQTENVSSILGKDYIAAYATDWDVKTAWVEGKKGDGVGEWISIQGKESGLLEVSGIKIINGYAKSENLYKANNRVKKVKIEFSDGSSMEKEVKDSLMDYQRLEFGKIIKTKFVKITILEVYNGTKYEDTCISGIKFFHIQKF
ncbi:MAG: stalk domain-containing protein [Clostridia bacterium]|nr:stalk domain-containing protein [Clostridia bacterium]